MIFNCARGSYHPAKAECKVGHGVGVTNQIMTRTQTLRIMREEYDDNAKAPDLCRLESHDLHFYKITFNIHIIHIIHIILSIQ